MQIPNDMLKSATIAMQNAYAPYSKFHVGACIRGANNQLFSGCNVENVSYGLTMCAEANALGAFIKEGQKKFKEALIISTGEQICPPCGACRQRLYEFALPDALIYLCSKDNKNKILKLSELLPLPFSSELTFK